MKLKKEIKRVMMELEMNPDPLSVEQRLAYSRALRAAADASERAEERKQKIKAVLKKILIFLRSSR